MSKLVVAAAQGSSLNLLLLLHSALSGPVDGLVQSEAVRFIKESPNCLLSDRVFSTVELRQIYICLQQLLIKV